MDKPEYIPLPRTGTKCPYCGLSRSGINNLIGRTKVNGYRPLVKSTKVCQKGRKRGRTLVHYDSLMTYLNAQVVPLERLALRKPWIAFRAETRRCKGIRPPSAVDFAACEDLPEDDLFPEI